MPTPYNLNSAREMEAPGVGKSAAETVAPSPLNIEEAVRNRYSGAAAAVEPDLCSCAVDYDARFLAAIPQEIMERDYGCGDPSAHIQPGEAVLDLGSGGGKICYIAAQIVGASGSVIGVDCNDDMLALARKYRTEVAERLGFANVDFRKGKIQDLGLNLELFDRYLAEHPARCSSDWLRAEEHARQLRQTSPLVADESVDVIVSSCVLNLVRPEDRASLFAEMHRVLRPGGRAVISDIVCDEDVPAELQADPRLWSGCISGAFREDRFLEAFEQAGFYGVEILVRQERPWAVVAGFEFRSMTVRAYKGGEGPRLDRKQAVIYNGPWKEVVDDDGQRLFRGRRMAVCDKTFHIYMQPPYAGDVTPIAPRDMVPLDEAPAFAQHRDDGLRSPRETKGTLSRELTQLPDGDCCGSAGCC